MTTTLIDCIAAIPSADGTRARAFITKLENAKKTPPISADPSSAVVPMSGISEFIVPPPFAVLATRSIHPSRRSGARTRRSLSAHDPALVGRRRIRKRYDHRVRWKTGIVPVDAGIIPFELRRLGHAGGVLVRPNDVDSFDLFDGFGYELRRQRRDARGQLSGGFAGSDREPSLQRHGTRIHLLLHPHHRDARDFVSREDGPSDGCGTAPTRQETRVSVDAVAEPGKLANAFGDELAERDHDAQLGRRVAQGRFDLGVSQLLRTQQRDGFAQRHCGDRGG